MSRKRIIPNGSRFGRLTVSAEYPQLSRHHLVQYECACDCGQTTIVEGSRLKKGTTTSCGCYRRELAAARFRDPTILETIRQKITTHGMTLTAPEYAVWHSMRQRCNDPTADSYPRYGGRGIKVCPEWNSFEQFLTDMGSRPSSAHSLDRINNDQGYSPDNCRWATRKEQGRNRSTNHNLTFDNVTRTMTEWAEVLGIRDATLRSRLRRGWPLERALCR